MSDKKIVTYVGVCTTLEEKKGGWYRIHIAVPGKQYTVKPETKLEHLITKARELRDSGVVATWSVEEWPSDNINPNNNQPYTERRLSSVEEGTAGGSTTPSGTNDYVTRDQVEPHHDPIHFADKDRVISRLSLLSTASILFTGKAITEFEDRGPEDVPLAVMAAATRFEHWVYRDIDPLPSTSSGRAAAPPEPEPPPPPVPPPSDYAPQDEYVPPVPVDDDIPF